MTENGWAVDGDGATAESVKTKAAESSLQGDRMEQIRGIPELNGTNIIVIRPFRNKKERVVDLPGTPYAEKRRRSADPLDIPSSE